MSPVIPRSAAPAEPISALPGLDGDFTSPATWRLDLDSAGTTLHESTGDMSRSERPAPTKQPT